MDARDREPGRIEWSREAIEKLAERAGKIVAEHIDDVARGPAFRPLSTAVRDRLRNEALPVEGCSAAEVFDAIAECVAPYPMGNGHPRYWGWVNSPPHAVGIFAELVASAMNPSCAGGNHVGVTIEGKVIDWFREALGFPTGSAGVLTSGGSMATFTALAAARRRALDVEGSTSLQTHRKRLLAYGSTEVHSCALKSLDALGLGVDSLRRVRVDEHLALDLGHLRELVQDDRKSGEQPFLMLANAGSASTGTIDPLAELVSFCREQELWLHVDASYGGPAILAEASRERLEPLCDADSVAIDPHKWLSVPVDAGLVLVRDRELLRRAFSHVPPYLARQSNAPEVSGDPWLSELTLEQTRPFRALKVWACLLHIGLARYGRLIDEQVRIARRLHDEIDRLDGFESFERPPLSIVCFRHRPQSEHGIGKRLDAINRQLLQRLQLEGTAFLTSTEIRGELWLRACIVNFHTSDADVELFVDALRRTLRTL